LCFLGAPGVGKGTFAGRVGPMLGIPTISSGDLIRSEIAKGTALGLDMTRANDSGQLVGDSIMIEMIRARLNQSDAERGYILDGFPRRITQAEALNRFTTLDLVVNIVLREDVLVEKAVARRVCNKCGHGYNIANIQRDDIRMPPLLPKVPGKCDRCDGTLIQRSDDQESVVRNRLGVYHSETFPLIDYYTKAKILVDFHVKRGIADLPDLIALLQDKTPKASAVKAQINPTYTH